MSSRDTKIKRTLLERGLGLLAKEYEKRLSYGNTRVHDNMVPWALRLLGTTTLFVPYVYLHDKKKTDKIWREAVHYNH